MGDCYALVSAGGAPGVTTAAIAMALTWPSPVILAECDPSGGDILAGLLGGRRPARQGLMEHAVGAGSGPEAAHSILASQLVPLDAAGGSMLLPGMTDPRQSAGLGSAWSAIAATLAEEPADVIADCGRLDAGASQPVPVLLTARVVALVLRPSLRQVWAARSRADMLTRLLGGTDSLGLLLTGPGPYDPAEIAAVLGIDLIARLPADAGTAAALSDGAAAGRAATRKLIKSAAAAGQGLRRHGQRATAGSPGSGLR